MAIVVEFLLEARGDPKFALQLRNLFIGLIFYYITAGSKAQPHCKSKNSQDKAQ